MANPAVTYNFVNGTTADGDQVDQNFQDIIDALTDGTKNLSISALTAAGTATFNGAVTLGNGAPDDITVTGSLASSIPIKTTAAYDIGAATLGLRAIYFGGNSQTVNIRGSGSMSATYTLTLPVDAGTVDFVLKTNGSGVTSWSPALPYSAAGADADTTLTVASRRTQIIVPTATRAYTLPTTSVIAGDTFCIVNNAANGSGFNITIKSSGANTIVTCYPQTSQEVTALQDTPTTAAHWRIRGTIQPASQVRVNTGNATPHGSTNTKIRRFAATSVTVGADITYADSATLGASFTINADGVYSVYYMDVRTGGAQNCGISLNATSGAASDCTLDIDSGAFSAASVRVTAVGGAASTRAGSSATVICAKGDIIRPHTDGTQNTTADNQTIFHITQVAKF